VVPPALVDEARRNLSALKKLHDELAGSGGVVVLGGPRGVGKALLLTELRRELGQQGRLVLLGRPEQAATQPYAMFRDPMTQALAFLEARGQAERFLDAHAPALQMLVPALASSSAPNRPRDKTAFFESLRALFLDLGRHGPLTLLLVDVHYADDDSRDALRFLARHLFAPDGVDVDDAFTGVMMVSARSDDADGARVVEDIADGPRTRLFVVEGLNRDGLVAYLAQHPLLDRLLQASRGRPEDVDELLETLPPDTDALLRQRIDALDDVAQRAVRALAVLGRPATADLVAAIVGAAVGEVARHLGALVDKRLLTRRLANGELLFSFARPHHQEVILRALDGDTTRRLHQAIGNAIAARDAPEELQAFHLLRGTMPEQGLTHALSAAEKLLLTFAYGSAVELLRQALPVATRAAEDEVDDGRRDEFRQLRIALLGHLVEAERMRGHLEDALRAAEELRAVAPPEQMPQVLRRVGELLSQRGEHREALDVLEEALARADDARDSLAPQHLDHDRRGRVGRGEPPRSVEGDAVDDGLPERALALAAMAEVAYKKADLDGAVAFAERALHAAPAAPTAFKLRVRNTLAKVAYSREAWAAAEAAFLENLRVAEEHRLGHEAVLARINIGLARHRTGRHEEAREMLERGLTAARAVGDIAEEARALLNLGTIAQRLGDLPRALDAYRAALTRFLRIGNRSDVRLTTWNLANLSVALGNLDAAETYLEQSRRIAVDDEDARGLAFVQTTEGELALARGEPARALLGYERAREAFARLGERSRVDEMATKSAWALLLVGDIEAARQKLASVPRPAAPVAAVRHEAIGGAIESYGPGGAVGLARLQAAIDELVRLRATDDAWRALAWQAERADELGDARAAAAARMRGREIVEQQAAGLPEAMREVLLRDPLRSRLFVGPGPARSAEAPPTVLPSTRVDDPPAAGVSGPASSLSSSAPPQRKPEWDARYKDIVGRSPPLHRVFDRLDRLARTKQGTVLVRGESGTGKELVAAAIHRQSDRAAGPFVRVNCAALVETLLMSELFGHEKGSFTGALARKIGRFELARGGTIFLDEIGDISPKTQVSLLRVLQERQFERVGGTQTIATDAAVICATHRDLDEMVRQGAFREDLYYRLKVVVVEMPALRERAEDIPLLVQGFLDKARAELGRAPRRLTPAATDVLCRHRWPGNIRELQNVVRSVALFCESDVIDVDDLAEFPELFAHGAAPGALDRAPDAALRPAVVVMPTAASTLPAPAASAVPLPPASFAPGPLAPAPFVPVAPAVRLSTPAPAPAPSSSSSSPAAPWPSGQAATAPSTPEYLRRVGEDSEGLALGDLKRRLEFEAVANAIRQTGGNVTRAAAMLKMKRPRLSQIINANPDLKAIKQGLRSGGDEDE
jgi:DNA-binding NtrC family response regulator/tetratricopeptide (TPR) repeat protein